MGEEVSTLEGLWKEAEDVVDEEEGAGGGWGAGVVCVALRMLEELLGKW